MAGGPASDGFVTITAYTIGEEGFTDTNGNGVFDDGDAGFEDLEEPYVDANEDNIFSSGDLIIDVVSVNDPTGANGVMILLMAFIMARAVLTLHYAAAQHRSQFLTWSRCLLSATHWKAEQSVVL